MFDRRSLIKGIGQAICAGTAVKFIPGLIPPTEGLRSLKGFCIANHDSSPMYISEVGFNTSKIKVNPYSVVQFDIVDSAGIHVVGRNYNYTKNIVELEDERRQKVK